MKTTAEKYIRFETRKYSEKRTYNYLVRNIRTNAICGEIKWYGGFRKYCFFPTDGFLFDASCLSAITEKLDTLNREHREQRKTRVQ